MEEEAGQPGQKTSSDVNNQDRDGCMDQRSEGHHNTENHIDECTWQGKKPVPFILASNGYHSTVWVQAPVPRMKLTYWSSFEAMVLYNRCRMYKQDLRTHEIRIEQIRRQNREEVERSWRSSAASTSPNENWWDSWWWNGEWWEGQTNSPSSIEDDDGDVENCKPKAKPMPIRRGVVVLPKPKPRVIPPRNLDAVEESIATTGTEGSKTGEPGPSQPEKQSSAAILEKAELEAEERMFRKKTNTDAKDEKIQDNTNAEKNVDEKKAASKHEFGNEPDKPDPAKPAARQEHDTKESDGKNNKTDTELAIATERKNIEELNARLERSSTADMRRMSELRQRTDGEQRQLQPKAKKTKKNVDEKGTKRSLKKSRSRSRRRSHGHSAGSSMCDTAGREKTRFSF
jgi:hypothetical protein